MKKITKENINEFLEYYHNFHDGVIKSIIYDCDQAKIKFIIEIFWVGKDEVNKDGKYNTKRRNIKLVFNQVENVNIKERFSWDFITEAYLKFITINNKELLCFADNDTNPDFYCVSESLEYEEMQ